MKAVGRYDYSDPHFIVKETKHGKIKQLAQSHAASKC